VISTIHQPRSELWSTFDSVFLLAKGGRLIYEGPRAEVLETFAAAGEPCPSGWNPADFLLDAVSIDYYSADRQQVSEHRVAKLVSLWELSSRMAQLEFKKEGEQPIIPKSPGDYKAQSMRIALPVVTARSFK
jgi:hypothetical protein